MRTPCFIITFGGLASTLCLIGLTALYAAGALAAAQSVRPVPFVGGLAAGRIERWTLGAAEDYIIEEADTPNATLPADATPTFQFPLSTLPFDCIPSGLPVDGFFVRGFRPPHALNHTGIDIGVVTGTPVQATQCGTVTYAGWSNVGYGNLVIIEHNGISSYYAHNSHLLVAVNQQVTYGQPIALSGNTGNSTGPHVHYETRVRGVPVDPTQYP